MRILVLAGETADLGPRSTLLGLCRALRASTADLDLATTLPDETADEDPAPVVRGLPAAFAEMRRSDLVLVTHDALAQPGWRSAALLHSLRWTRGVTAGVALLTETTSTRTGRWVEARSLRRLGVLTAADERSASRLVSLAAGAVRVLPDPALLVPAAFADLARTALAEAGAPCDGTPLIGVVPRHVPLRGRTREESDERLVGLLARVLALAVEEHDAFIVCLPASAADEPLCNAIAATLRIARGCVTPLLDPATFKGIAAELAVLLSAHRRAALLAAAVGRPTIGLGESAALATALERAGAGHAFLDASLFLRGSLVAQLGDLIDTALETHRTPVLRVEELRAGVRAGIRSLLELVD